MCFFFSFLKKSLDQLGLLLRCFSTSEYKIMPDHLSFNISLGRASAIIHVPLFYVAFTYAYFHKSL